MKSINLTIAALLCALICAYAQRPPSASRIKPAVPTYALATHAADQNVPPTMAQAAAAVNEFIHKAFKDPYSVQDLTIYPAYWNKKATIHKDWVIPFSCDAKNSFGAYIGLRRHYAMWRDGKLDVKACNDRIYWEKFAESEGVPPEQ